MKHFLKLLFETLRMTIRYIYITMIMKCFMLRKMWYIFATAIDHLWMHRRKAFQVNDVIVKNPLYRLTFVV